MREAPPFRALARGFPIDDLADVALPVLDFLAKRPRRHAHQLVVRSSTPVAEALAIMTDEHVHRVWVVDGDNHPRGVVTMRCARTRACTAC